MKKLMTVGAIILASNNFAQTINFENQLGSPESYENGSLGGGDFDIDYLTFSNDYNAAWDAWTGFSISNVTDNTTPGYFNQYASFPGIGVNSSATYGVYYLTGGITANNNGYIEGFSITNTAYAGLSMRDGDGFGKQFGSIYAGDGVTVDGTNGEDYFRVWIIAENVDQTAKDSIEFYLADFRFVDDNDDYILDTWEYIDLSGLSVSPSSVSFRFESSDVGAGGINTPTYFAIDNIDYAMPLALDELEEEKLNIYPNPAQSEINISGLAGIVKISNLYGQVVYTGQHQDLSQIDISELDYGMYVISVSDGNGIIASERLIIQ